jgi:hypothetical protein
LIPGTGASEEVSFFIMFLNIVMSILPPPSYIFLFLFKAANLIFSSFYILCYSALSFSY